VARSSAIKAGAVLDNKVVSAVFDAAIQPGERTFANDHKRIVDHAIPLLDLAGNA